MRPPQKLATFSAVAYVALQAVSSAEPGLAPTKASDFIYCGVAGVIIVIALLGLGAFSTCLLQRWRPGNRSFFWTTVLFAGGWAVLGVISGLIPMILLAALIGPAGRTM
jgi:hypothetical protein